MRIFVIILLIVVVLITVGWVGFQVKPKDFSIETENLASIKEREKINNLPTEVTTYLEKVILEEDEALIETSIVWGQTKVKVNGIWMSGRFITYYHTASSFYRYLEITWFGIPCFKGYDLYTEDCAEFCMGNKVETGYKIEQGQNMALWAELLYTPKVYASHQNLVWKEIDETKAHAVIPFKNNQDDMIFYFDQETGFVDRIMAMRYQGVSEEKSIWTVDCMEWKEFDHCLIPSTVALSWEGDKGPWSYWYVKGVKTNVLISGEFKQEFRTVN